MCRKDGTIFLVDFGWAVKRGPDGDNQLYPNHPTIKNTIAIAAPWYYLEATQNLNIEDQFFSNQKDYDKAKNAYKVAYEKFRKSLR
jgi:hypothetical protein